MSSIRIVCRKGYEHESKDCYKSKEKLGDELILDAKQFMLNTEKFFNTVKETLEKYFDSVVQVKK